MILNKRNRAGFISVLLLPSLLLVGAFVIFPLINGLRLSFTNASPMRANRRWIGVDNFERLLTDSDFWEVVFNSILIVGVSILLATLVGFVLALMLNTKLRGVGLFRGAVFQVWIVPWIAVTILWGWLFNADFGIVNYTLQWLGLLDEPLNWLATPRLAQIVVILGFAWRTVPFMMVVSLGALQSIPKDLYEAAHIDGATRWQAFRLVTLPLLKPAMIPAIILGTVWTFNMFNIIYLVSGGAPGGKTDILITQAYYAFKVLKRFGLAAAYALIIFLILLLFGVMTNRISKAAEGVYE